MGQLQVKAHPISLGGRPVVGFGAVEELVAPALVAAGPSPWTLAIGTSVVGAAAAWVFEEFATSMRGRRRRR